MVDILEIPALTLEQKQKFWKLGQKLWQITVLEVYENIARNVALVIRRQWGNHSLIGVVELHWSTENPFRLLLALLRHLVNSHLAVRVHWYGQPPPRWKSIAPLLPAFPGENYNSPRNTFPLYFVDEVTFLRHLGKTSHPVKTGLLTVLPDVKKPFNPELVEACTTTLVLDFPTIEFLRLKLEQPAIRSFLGNTGIPLHLVEQLGIKTGKLFSTESIIDLDLPEEDWHGRHCACSRSVCYI